MQTRALRISKHGLVTIRPLRNGDTATVAALFERLAPTLQARRFDSTKPHFSDAELAQFATVDGRCHTLVAYMDRDPVPAGIAQLVRDRRCCTNAEIAFSVADSYDGQRIGSALVQWLANDARAAGITHLTAARYPGRIRRSSGRSREVEISGSDA
jgi:GNAT superfamily N-acetyltransferase